MNFEYDFKDGHTRFSYRSKPGEVLDEKTWSILTQGTANQFLLPANANQDGNGFIFTYSRNHEHNGMDERSTSGKADRNSAEGELCAYFL